MNCITFIGSENYKRIECEIKKNIILKINHKTKFKSINILYNNKKVQESNILYD